MFETYTGSQRNHLIEDCNADREDQRSRSADQTQDEPHSPARDSMFMDMLG